MLILINPHYLQDKVHQRRHCRYDQLSHWQYIYRIWRQYLPGNCRHWYGTNYAPLLAYLFLHWYEAEFVHDFLRKREKKWAQSFDYTFLYIVMFYHSKCCT